jgi:myo-inositol-1-phosphate synthase
MNRSSRNERIRLAIAGVGNCAGSLLEGITYYRERHQTQGLLFPLLGGYAVGDIEVVAAYDVARDKVGRPLSEAIYQPPNNFVRIPNLAVNERTVVMRAPTLDGNPSHLARFVPESPVSPENVADTLRDARAQVLVNLLPTGSLEATAFYAQAAITAGCAFVNCIPTVLAQRPEIQEAFRNKRLPLLGDDIKSQLGTTILHRTLLQMLLLRGAHLLRTSQINIGGNTDFANFVYRAETKLASKRKSMATLVREAESHVGHHYDITRGPHKHAFIEIEAAVFGGSPVKLSIRLESDDKPNSAGSVVDLIRIAKTALDMGRGGIVPEACAFYMKSPPVEMDEIEALHRLREKWVRPARRREIQTASSG